MDIFNIGNAFSIIDGEYRTTGRDICQNCKFEHYASCAGSPERLGACKKQIKEYFAQHPERKTEYTINDPFS